MLIFMYPGMRKLSLFHARLRRPLLKKAINPNSVMSSTGGIYMKRTFLTGCMVVSAFIASPAHAAWDYKLIEDPMTDAKRGISSVMGDEGMLVVKCDRNGPGTLYLSIISKKYLGGISGRKNRSMRFRIDRGEPQTIDAFHDGSTASVFNLAPNKAGGAFLNQLLDARELVVQVTSFDYDSYTIIFNTAGAREAVTKSARDCGDTNWSSASTPPE